MTGMMKEKNEAAVDALLERITDLLEQSLELIASAGREKRLAELTALTSDIALLSAAAARLRALGGE